MNWLQALTRFLLVSVLELVALAFLTIVLAGVTLAIWHDLAAGFTKRIRASVCLALFLRVLISALVGLFLAADARTSRIVATPDLGYVRFWTFTHPQPEEFDNRNVGKSVTGESGFPFSTYTECSVDIHGTIPGTACEKRSRYGEWSVPMNWLFWSCVLGLTLILERVLLGRSGTIWLSGDKSGTLKYLRRKIAWLSLLLVVSAIGTIAALFLRQNAAVVVVGAGYLLLGSFRVALSELLAGALGQFILRSLLSIGR